MLFQPWWGMPELTAATLNGFGQDNAEKAKK
jgi:hypothetical protein